MKVDWKEQWPHTSIKDASMRNKNSVYTDTKQDMYSQAVKYIDTWRGGYIPPKQLHKQKVIIRYINRYYPELCL